jgi:cysteine desulfurase
MLPRIKPSKKLIYLDHAATTPLHPEVKRAMEPFRNEKFGNPSSLYRKGREASDAIRNARTKIAKCINARAEEIIFTAGGTESINLAVFGVARAVILPLTKGELEGVIPKPHIITTAIEHHAVLKSVEALKQEGHNVTVVGVDGKGFADFDELKRAVRPETILISIMYANNEVGTVQPIVEIGKWLKKVNTERVHNGLTQIALHTDACQAAGFLDVDVHKLGVDLMSGNGSKMYGPKQTGFLYVRSGVNLKPLIYGGEQERSLRSGTENVAGIVGLAEAFRISQKDRLKENKRLIKLRDYFAKQILKRIPDVVVNGPAVSSSPPEKEEYPVRLGEVVKDKRITYKDNYNRLPNNLNLSFLGLEGESLMLYLDAYNIAVSTGSACTTANPDPSHVLLAMGRNPEEAQSSIRFTLGRSTTKKELDYVLKILPGIVGELRSVNN